MSFVCTVTSQSLSLFTQNNLRKHLIFKKNYGVRFDDPSNLKKIFLLNQKYYLTL